MNIRQPGGEQYYKIALILSILGGYLLTDTEAPNVDGHHPLPASHDFHPRSLESVLLEDSINSEGMHLRVIYSNDLSDFYGMLYSLSSNFTPYNAFFYFRH